MKAYGWLGLVVLLLSEYFLLRRVEPFYSWFYSFAWWAYILIADSLLLRLRGRSLLTTRRSELRIMLPLSVCIWLLFEAYNLVIRNWAYEEVPSQLWIRWPGYALAFSTVLPGIFITSDIIETLLFGRRTGPAASEAEFADGTGPEKHSAPIFLAGLFLSAAPLIWPRFFFPAVWVGPIFLLHPLLRRVGLQGLSLSAASGRQTRPWSLMAAGLVCGGLWEFWNYWAGSRWVYSVPFFDDWKLFEMPILGYLGFPPFAIECWILYHLLAALHRRMGRAAFLLWITLGVLSLLVFRAIDRETVLRFAAPTPGH